MRFFLLQVLRSIVGYGAANPNVARIRATIVGTVALPNPRLFKSMASCSIRSSKRLRSSETRPGIQPEVSATTVA